MSEFAVGSIENALYYTLSDKVPGLDQELCENIIKNNFIPGNNLQNLFQVMQNNKQIYAKYIQTTSIQEINAENIFCLLFYNNELQNISEAQFSMIISKINFILVSFIYKDNDEIIGVFRKSNNYYNTKNENLPPEELLNIFQNKSIFLLCYSSISFEGVQVLEAFSKKMKIKQKYEFYEIIDNEKFNSHFKIGEQYPVHELLLKIDSISKSQNRILKSKRIKKYFEYKCPYCEATISGPNHDDVITINKIVEHTCDQHGYRPNCARRNEDSYLLSLHNSVNLYSKERLANMFNYARSTLYRLKEKADENSNSQNLNEWQKIPSLLEKFSIGNGKNVYLEKSETNAIQKFFILPDLSIYFLNSPIFQGFIITDGTFLKFFKVGELIIYASYLPSNQIIPLAFGYCLSENSEDLKLFLNIIKENLNDESYVKCFMSDSNPAILLSEKQTFEGATRKQCLFHQEKNLNANQISTMYKIANAVTLNECQEALEEHFKNYNEKNPEKFKKKMMKNSRFFEPSITQNERTNGACESLNSVLKRESFNGVVSYIKALYEYEYNRFINLQNEIALKYTRFVADTIRDYNIQGGVIVKSFKDNIAKVSQRINGKTYEFVVTKHMGRIECSCNMEKVLGFGCIHIYNVCQTNDQWKFDQSVHDSYKKEQIELFCQSIPRFIDLTSLIVDEDISIVQKRNKKIKSTRYLSAMDHKSDIF